jgi:hypothetical protein
MARPFFWCHLVASYDSQGHGGGIRPRLHTGYESEYVSMRQVATWNVCSMYSAITRLLKQLLRSNHSWTSKSRSSPTVQDLTLVQITFLTWTCRRNDLLKSRNLILSRVLVTNNAGSGLDERVYLLLIHTTSNYM